MITERSESEERSETCPVGGEFLYEKSIIPLPLDEGEKAGCSSSLSISRYRVPGRAVSVAPARYDPTLVRAGGKAASGCFTLLVQTTV